MSSNPVHPRLIFGGSTIGGEWGSFESVTELLRHLKTYGINEIDAAALYPVTNSGACERLLGEASAKGLLDGFKVDTKIVTGWEADGTLESAKITDSVSASQERLSFQGDQRLHIVHCHAVDSTTPIEEQAATLQELYKKGAFDKLGVCNFPLDVLAKFIDVCEQRGYVKPTVYQGLYNVVSRGHEQLFPFLRKHGIIFNAHSPVASGFLSGKLTAGNVEGTRFGQGNIVSTALKNKYDKTELHDAIHLLNKVLQPAGISNVEASLRWIGHHSQLRPEDGIILGATKLQYIQENVESLQKGPLPDDVVSAIDKIWETLAGQ